VECVETIFSVVVLSHLLYIYTFIYNLIPMLIQIIFSYFIQHKNILKTIIITFSTQGIVLAISRFIYDMIYSIHQYSHNLGFWSIITSKHFRFNVIYSLIFFIILIGINFFIYINEVTKINYKKFISLIAGYIINIIVVIFMMLKFKIFLLPPI